MNTRTYMQSQSQKSAHSADATGKAPPAAQSALSAAALAQTEIRNTSGIALVITLLMLSVITFLAVALLVLTRTHRDTVSNTLDEQTAKAMSEAAVARAETEIVAHIMAHHDLFNYDYMASHNAINPGGFRQGLANATNVNYDYYSTGAPMSPTANGGLDWAQNIANLWPDPRVPVFIRTNSNPAFPADFRFWVDLNRNGRFETNGYLPFIQANGQPIVRPQ